MLSTELQNTENEVAGASESFYMSTGWYIGHMTGPQLSRPITAQQAINMQAGKLLASDWLAYLRGWSCDLYTALGWYKGIHRHFSAQICLSSLFA
jgi:hypothetical protein